MKLAAYLLLPAFVLSGQQPPVATCFVSGRVLNAANNEPVRRARLTLSRTDRPVGSAETPPAYTTATDDRGRFAMKGIEPGKYDFWVQHAGFTNTEYGARRPGRSGVNVSLDAGQRLTGIVFRMTPHAVIAGRILDRDGDPLQGVQITTVRYRFNMGKRQLFPSGHASTDDQGEYRLFGLAPGRYYLQATYRESPMMTLAARTAPKTAEESYMPTYYPGVVDTANATLIDLSAGTQLRGMDFTLSKMRGVRVRGRVIAPAAVNRHMVAVMLTPRNRAFWTMVRRVRVTDPEGGFELGPVGPGTYNLTANLQDGKVKLSAFQRLDVGASNIEDVTLTLSAGTELAGQLRFESGTPPSLTGIELRLDSLAGEDVWIGGPSCEVREDGSFTLTNIGNEVYRTRVTGLPDGYYLKSVRLGDDELRETGIDASRELAGPLILTVSSRAGLIEGVVMNAKEQPVPGAAVVLVPDPKKRERFEAFHSVTTDQYGRYTVKNIEPGEYKLFAWEDLEPGEYMDPEFLKPMEGRGVPMNIHEASRENTDLKLIPAKPDAK